MTATLTAHGPHVDLWWKKPPTLLTLSNPPRSLWGVLGRDERGQETVSQSASLTFWVTHAHTHTHQGF